ncbi:acetolactate synthase 2 small subunit [Enterobacteriaceae endosymbiont of Donacia tomentosa]|uniref:acetolactate synthase 2 small subunit n=1 Tax=Enterobacteriaceae endosymbiont of Donacia tomentosa TaxID=2675787 RepID=UPI0014498442|nr:acetolactate synthase 2 small subunit [Enterobacteriaceae endosymbiont of Donacia tomentosa]QJC31632.1 acetolactate synthase 2 small subunit [Enterobacteriaceae endosymbiont of Donacia tomentosa]
MNKYQLLIKTNISPEISERIIRIIRHRGFVIKTMKMEVISRLKNITFNLTIKSYKSINLLIKQIEKLIDVIHIAILEQIP